MTGEDGTLGDVSDVTVDDVSLDVHRGTLTLHWRDSAADRSAMLFLGHVLRRAGDPRGRTLLQLARAAGGVGEVASDEDLVDDFV